MRILLPLVWLLCPFLIAAQDYPGGINNASMSLWLKADAIDATPGTPITNWYDLSGNNNHASTIGFGPVLQDSVINNHKAVVFKASEQRALSIPHNPQFNSQFLSIFLVGKMNDSAGSKSSFIMKANDNAMSSGFGLLRMNSIEKVRFYAGDYTENRDSEPFSYNISDLFVGTLRTGNSNNKIVTLVNNAGGTTTSNAPVITNTAPVVIGARANGLGGLKSYLDGAISEIIVINEDVASVERIIISNYLAAKYQMGISNQKYSYFHTHRHDLIGIGKYGGITHGSSTHGMLTVEENSTKKLTNSEFLMIAHDGKSETPVPTTVLHQYSQRVERTWRAHVNGTINKENLRFSLNNIDAPTNPDEFYLILDLDGDEDFSNASIIPATAYDNATNEMVFEGVNVITGSVFTLAFSNSITWDGSEYKNGSGVDEAPNAMDYHRKLYTFGPGAHIAGEAHVHSVTNTMSGTIEVDSNVCFTVTENIVNEGVFTVEENASLIQLGSGKNKNVGAGTYIVQRTGLNTIHGFNNWSSPVQRQDIVELFDGTNHCDIFTYSGLFQDWRHDYAPGFVGDCLGNAVTFAPGSSILFGDGYMDIGRGYFVPGNAAHAQKHFIGNVNNGDYIVPLVATDLGHNPNWNDDDWNFVGNPYPSALDPYAFWNENAVTHSRIQDALYFWDDLGVAGSEYDQYNDYSAWNLTGGIASDNSSKIVSNLNHIASGQGFFIWADTTGARDSAGVFLNTLVFNNSMRSCLNSQFFKTDNPIQKELIWLTLSNPSGDMVKTLVGMVQDATDKKDVSYDARKPPRSPALNMASTINGDTTGYMIQGVSFTTPVNLTKKISIKFTTNQTGVHTFKRGAFTKTNNYTKVYLEDTYLNVLHPIEDSDYSVNINQMGTNYDRFKVVFKSTLQETAAGSNSGVTTGVEENMDKLVNVYYYNGHLNIVSNQNLNSKVTVYDLTGKQVLNNNNQYTNTTTTIPLSAANGVYIVKLTEANGNSTTHRVVVN